MLLESFTSGAPPCFPPSLPSFLPPSRSHLNEAIQLRGAGRGRLDHHTQPLGPIEAPKEGKHNVPQLLLGPQFLVSTGGGDVGEHVQDDVVFGVLGEGGREGRTEG